MRNAFIIFLAVFLAGCAHNPTTRELDNCIMFCPKTSSGYEIPKVVKNELTELRTIKTPERQAVVAVYDFPDLTGQRKDKDNVASFSTAVTQGSTALLIDALKVAGNGKWFKVVERNRIDDLAKERQIVRQTREEYLGKDANKLEPMLFAGIVLQGGIIGYDSNLVSGGVGARYLGIGADTQYRKDQVVVSLRAVSTNTGEVLMNVQVSKTVLSVSRDLSLFRFVDVGTKLVEAESGMTQNEANTIAVKTAIEQAVIELIKQGIERGYWKYQE
jgi:curli production assembly/transport component CsgG